MYANYQSNPFPWAANSILYDDEAPSVERVALHPCTTGTGSELRIEFSETVSQSQATQRITVSGNNYPWSRPQGSAYALASPCLTLPPGNHNLTIATGVLDLSGNGLDAPFNLTLPVSSPQGDELVFEAVDASVVSGSATGTAIGFHGRPVDEVTGWGYMRNRWLDPEIGQFVSVDPLGFVDGPSMYIFAGYDPVNMSDPLGLACVECRGDASRFNPPQLPEPGDTVWSTEDLLRWVLNGYNNEGSQGHNYLLSFKEKWVAENRDVILRSAKVNDLPPELIGGVAMQEVGGDPMWLDDLAYSVRSLGPVTRKDPLLTSFGNISMQLRRAAETLGLNPDSLTAEEKALLIAGLKDSKTNVRFVAAHLSDIRELLLPGKKAEDFTDEDIRFVSIAYNRGPHLSRERLEQNSSYGDAVMKRISRAERALSFSGSKQGAGNQDRKNP